jgi:ubiquinone/menaquinone biosynthesis C-methylase UbiE
VDPVRRSFDEAYVPAQLAASTATAFDRRLTTIRRELLAEHVRGRALDLCCGAGHHFDAAREAADVVVGVDFSATMLRAAPAGLLVQGDARSLPFRTETFDSVFSYTSLYYVADLAAALQEVRRVLVPGGRAVFELGNRTSLNTVVTRAHARSGGWAPSSARPFGELSRAVEAVGQVLVWRSFQVLPMLRATRALLPLVPLTHPGWKLPLGATAGGRMLDERLSSSRLLRRVAFRHLVVVQRG